MASLLDRVRRKPPVDPDSVTGTFEAYPHLMQMRPKQGYMFHSDYFEVDDQVGCVLTFMHDDDAQDDYGVFWGANRIVDGLPDTITSIINESVERLGQGWVDDNIKKSEKIDRLGANDVDRQQANSVRRREAKRTADLTMVTGELQDGDSYLNVHMRMILKAPDLQTLDAAIEQVEAQYENRFSTMTLAPYHGEQRQELAALFGTNRQRRGKGMHFTSSEFAGCYGLVTNGLNDPAGVYVGRMSNDKNTSGIVFDIDGFDHHVVVASNGMCPSGRLSQVRVSSMWASKISQCCLANNGKVVHMVLDDTDMERLGPPLADMTAWVDMDHGDVNMFEMFGDSSDEISIFSTNIGKLNLMAQQAYKAQGAQGTIIDGTLSELLTQFYVDKGMWHRNAEENRERLRVVGVPHEDVPRLYEFYTYLETEEKRLQRKENLGQAEKRQAVTVLKLVFKRMLDIDGDLFNVHTKMKFDKVRESPRVIYRFQELRRRGNGSAAMMQFVNILNYAVSNLGTSDVLIIHGAELIEDDPLLKKYVSSQLDALYGRGGRVAFIYNDIDKMIAQAELNRVDRADWTMLGGMAPNTATAYQQVLGQELDPALTMGLVSKAWQLCYLRRDVTNVLFAQDLNLGLSMAKQVRITNRLEEEDGLEATLREREAIVAAENAAKREREHAETIKKSREPQPKKERKKRSLRGNDDEDGQN